MSFYCPRFSSGLVAVAALLLAACGAETASTAATAGAIKKNEIEEGRALQEQVQRRVQQSLDSTQQRTDQLEQATR